MCVGSGNCQLICESHMDHMLAHVQLCQKVYVCLAVHYKLVASFWSSGAMPGFFGILHHVNKRRREGASHPHLWPSAAHVLGCS